MSSKYERGSGFQFPVYTPPMSAPYSFSDRPRCEVAEASWEAREAQRAGMTDQERLADVRENGYQPVQAPRMYSRSCQCDPCRSAYMATFFKGILGKPSSQDEPDPYFTLEGFTDKFNHYKGLQSKFSPQDSEALGKALAALKSNQGGVFLLAVNRSMFQTACFLMVLQLWTLSIRAGVYYKVPPDQGRSTKHPQPDWAALSNIDEIANLQKDPEVQDDAMSRKLLMVSANGPFSEAQALMCFGPIRSSATKDNVVLVNSDDPTLRNYVTRLQKNLE